MTVRPGTNPAVVPGRRAPGTTVTVDPGTYTVDRDRPVRLRGALGDCTGTIAIGETKTCTVTNDDIAPKLIVNKVVNNDNGGTATRGDFTLDVDARAPPGQLPGRARRARGRRSTPALYTVTEAGRPATSAEARRSAPARSRSARPRRARSHNNDIPPVIKHVVNDGQPDHGSRDGFRRNAERRLHLHDLQPLEGAADDHELRRRQVQPLDEVPRHRRTGADGGRRQ